MKSVSGKEMCRILERNDWVLVRIHASHHKYKKLGSRPIIVPVHGNTSLKVGLQHAIMKAAGLTEGDL